MLLERTVLSLFSINLSRSRSLRGFGYYPLGIAVPMVVQTVCMMCFNHRPLLNHWTNDLCECCFVHYELYQE
jgi:hypothetical protein